MMMSRDGSATLRVVPPQAEAPPAKQSRRRRRAPVRLPEEPLAGPVETVTDLTRPDLYLNRETTWLAFNSRVLREAEDTRLPLLERVKFLAIASSNLDEFYMKRIGGLKQQLAAGVREVTIDGRTPALQLEECRAAIEVLDRRRYDVFQKLRRALRSEGVRLGRIARLDDAQRAAIRESYLNRIYPLVTPQATDPAHPFPFVSNLSLNLLVTLRYPGDPQTSVARVKVPVGAGIPRWMRVGNDDIWVALEDVMAHNLDLLFPGMEVVACDFFRVTRNANTERDEEQADDLLALIETELRDRRFAPTVRLEIVEGIAAARRGMLAAEIGLDVATDVVEVPNRLGLGDLFEIAAIDRPDLKVPPHFPVDPPDLTRDRNIFHVLRDAGSVLVHHPYESFATSVERFLAEAAHDPKVRAIKMTLYRTSEESRVIEHLMEAARHGKQVAVVVELKARFDEGANIGWANRLEEVGVHVTYGVVGLKTHCKVILVVRQDYDGLRRYAHIGTGNYHGGTARIYSDLGLFTADPVIGGDLTELFNYLTTGYRPKRRYRKLLVAPTSIKSGIIEKIDREIRHAAAGLPAHVQMKANALEDADLVHALYRASQAGVRVDLIVRDTCRLRPGIPGLSENVRVVSVIGRFLEHARIFYFANEGRPEYLIGSADMMQRNLESRVEVLVSVEDPQHQLVLRSVLDLELADVRNAWAFQSDGTYVRAEGSALGAGCQQILIERAARRVKDAGKLKRRKTKGMKRDHGV